MKIDHLKRLGLVAHGLYVLRKPPALGQLSRARGGVGLARRAIVPAGRNIGIAICLLPGALRHEARAAFLACRVLDAFEDLGSPTSERRKALEEAAACLCGRGASRPSVAHLEADRDSEQVDLLLASRIDDIRGLIAALPPDGRQRVERLIMDVAAVMADNLDDPLSRADYSRGVLGRATEYACELVTDRPVHNPDLCRSIGHLAQMANDLRDRECEMYDAVAPEELTRQIFLRMLPAVLAAFAVVRELNRDTRSRGARASIAYMMITTSSFLCHEADSPPPISRALRLPASLWAACSTGAFQRVLRRLEVAVDSAVLTTLSAFDGRDASGGAAALSLFGSRTGAERGSTPAPGDLPHLLVDSAFHLVGGLPDGRLDGDLPEPHGMAMMMADHLAFSSLDHLTADGTDQMRQLADLLQAAATDGLQLVLPPSDPRCRRRRTGSAVARISSPTRTPSN